MDATSLQTIVGTKRFRRAVLAQLALWGVSLGLATSLGLRAQDPITPEITGFHPVSGPPGTRITLEGVRLDGATLVEFNGVPALFGVLVAGQALYAIVPPDAVNGPITVTTPQGKAVSTTTFEVLPVPGPLIVSFSPDHGPGGTVVTIKGSNFTSVVAVRFNGAPASFNAFDHETILATVPSWATSGPLTVATAYGSTVSSNAFLIQTPQPPVLSGFSPANGPVGTAVLLQGTNLSQVNTVQFNGVNATFLLLGTNQISTSVPAGASTGPITVISPQGTNTSAGVFTVTLPVGPLIETFTPAKGRIGTPVLILGSNLNQTTGVKFNGVNAIYTTFSAAMIYTTVPADAVSGPITVETRVGTNTSASTFTVIRQGEPAITGFAPDHGGPGTLVTIQGTNLVNVTGVCFNGQNAAFTTNAGLQAIVPTGATTGLISVITLDGEAFSDRFFTAELGPIQPPALAIARISPSQITVSWPLDASPYVLQRTPALPENASEWLTLEEAPFEENGRLVVIVNTQTDNAFFRLIQPEH